MGPMEFGLLGPLVVRADGMIVPVQRGKQRALLATMLLSANRVVRVDEIAETLWGAAPPPSAPATIRNYVKRLRQALGDAGWGRISTHPRGYMIRVSNDELDITRSAALLVEARAAARDGSWAVVAIQAGESLSLWRGEPLADVESDALAAGEVSRLTEMRLQALELRIGAELHLGRHNEVTAELQQLSSAHPLREQFHAMLMLALYRGGRPAEALAVYQHVAKQLADELGADPGTELRGLHQRILAADPTLAAPRTPPTRSAHVIRRASPALMRSPLRCTRNAGR